MPARDALGDGSLLGVVASRVRRPRGGAATRLRGISSSRPRRRRDSAEDPRRGRGGAATRPRRISASPSRRRRGVRFPRGAAPRKIMGADVSAAMMVTSLREGGVRARRSPRVRPRRPARRDSFPRSFLQRHICSVAMPPLERCGRPGSPSRRFRSRSAAGPGNARGGPPGRGRVARGPREDRLSKKSMKYESTSPIVHHLRGRSPVFCERTRAVSHSLRANTGVRCRAVARTACWGWSVGARARHCPCAWTGARPAAARTCAKPSNERHGDAAAD